MLGNPPWERIKLQEQEFFAARSPEIAGAATKDARERLIKALESAGPGTSERAVFDAFVVAKREAEATSEFARVAGTEGGRFALAGRGDVNTYALFAELFANLARDRAGVILPTGIATDATTALFFAALIENRRLSSLISFENEEFIFPAVHHSFRFCLMTIVSAPEERPKFSFFLRNTAALDQSERSFSLSPEAIAKLNPNTRTAPVFRSRADAELTAKIYTNSPVLIEVGNGQGGNPWSVSFMTMFHMSNDSGLFRTAPQLSGAGLVREGADWVPLGLRPKQGSFAVEGNDTTSLSLKGGGPLISRYLPLYEAKMIHQFDHRWAGYKEGATDAEDVDLNSKQQPKFDPDPRYWVLESEVETKLDGKDWKRHWLLGWRDVTSAHVFRTVIATIFPRIAVGNSLPLMTFSSEVSAYAIAGLLGNLDALVFDFSARHKVGGNHLNFFIYQQLPVLPPHFYTKPRLAFVTPKVLELTYTSHSLASFARDLGHDGPPFAWDEDRRAHLRADLDAFYARAYGLTRDELRYILDPADVKGPDYPSETFRVLKEKEIRHHGEYRTRRLVLAAWERMEANGEFTAMGM